MTPWWARLRAVLGTPIGLWGITLLGLGLRLALFLQNRGRLRFYDEGDYHAIAVGLLEGRGFARASGVTAFRPPAEPLLAAAVYALFGVNPDAVRLLHVFLLSLLPLVVFRLAVRLFSDKATAGLAALLAAVHPGLAYAATTLYPAALSALSLSVGVWLVVEAVERNQGYRAVLGGLALGVSAACASYLAPLPVIAGGLVVARRRVRLGVWVAVFGLLPSVAWATRNLHTLGTFGLGTHGGYNLALGANDAATPRSGNFIEPPNAAVVQRLGEVARDRAYTEQAFAFIRARPVRWTLLSLGRAALVLDSLGNPKTEGAHASTKARALAWGLSLLVVVGLVGLWRARANLAAQIVAAALALVVVSSAVTIVKARFRFPVDPLITMLGAGCLVRRGAYERNRG